MPNGKLSANDFLTQLVLVSLTLENFSVRKEQDSQTNS